MTKLGFISTAMSATKMSSSFVLNICSKAVVYVVAVQKEFGDCFILSRYIFAWHYPLTDQECSSQSVVTILAK